MNFAAITRPPLRGAADRRASWAPVGRLPPQRDAAHTDLMVRLQPARGRQEKRRGVTGVIALPGK